MALESDRVAVFSSIAAQSALKKVKLHLLYVERDLESRRRMLQFMAFAFFSPYAVNSHDKVDLTTSGMSVQDATVVAQVLNASNPLRLLFDSSESECKVAHLLEQVTLLEPNGLRPTHLSAGTVVWVVHDQQNSSRIQVLVPGHGVHAIERTKLSTPATASPKQPVSQLTKKWLDQANVSLQNLEPVYFAQPHRPFPLRSKLSILSVADEACSGVNPIVQDALSQLNRTVFQQIFENAAPPMERVVRAVEDRNPLRGRRNEDL